MPYDPSLPLPNSPLESQVIRDQLQSLFVLIQNIASISAAQVDAVNTLPPGDPASVNLSVSGGTLHFTFGLPQGNTGPQGADGPQGSDGPPGPPFASAVVDGVTTLPPGSSAQVGVNFDGTNVRFTFGIPQGYDGATGPTGQPGEVSQTDLNNGLLNTLNQTSANTNNIITIDTTFADPDMEALRQKLNEMILNGRR
jgi:hypothetical protein